MQTIDEAVDVVSLVLRPVGGAAVPPHRAGQYVSVAVDLPDGSRQPRQYTISTGPRPETRPITVRRVRGLDDAPDGRVSTFLNTKVAPGDVLELTRPCGDVVLADSTAPLVLISAGVGVTPIAAIVDDVSRRSPGRPVILAHADRSRRCHALNQAITKSAAALADSVRYTWYEEPGAEDGTDGGHLRAGLMDLTEVPIPFPPLARWRRSLIAIGGRPSRGWQGPQTVPQQTLAFALGASLTTRFWSDPMKPAVVARMIGYDPAEHHGSPPIDWLTRRPEADRKGAPPRLRPVGPIWRGVNHALRTLRRRGP